MISTLPTGRGCLIPVTNFAEFFFFHALRSIGHSSTQPPRGAQEPSPAQRASAHSRSASFSMRSRRS